MPQPARRRTAARQHNGSDALTARSVRTARRRVRRRGSLLLTATAAAAACALFTTAALPQSASATPTALSPVAFPTPNDQQYTAADTAEAATNRDAFGVTVPGMVGNALPQQPTNANLPTVQWPFPGQVSMSSGFGFRVAPCASCSTAHQGLDLTPGAGTPIGAVAAGTVRISGLHSEFGQYAVIDHVIGGRRISTLYAHMAVGSSPLRAGQQVSAGQLVGLVGNSGRSTGAHLHLQVQLDGTYPIDPLAWLQANTGRGN